MHHLWYHELINSLFSSKKNSSLHLIQKYVRDTLHNRI